MRVPSVSRWRWTWLAVWPLLTGCAGYDGLLGRGLATPYHATAQQALLERDRAFARAIEEHGADGWASFFAEDGSMLVNGGGVVTGRAAVRQRMQRSFALPGFRLHWKVQRAEVSASGELGYTFGLYEASVDGGNEPSRGKYVTVWRKDPQGQWQVELEVGSEGQQMPAPPAETAH